MLTLSFQLLECFCISQSAEVGERLGRWVECLVIVVVMSMSSKQVWMADRQSPDCRCLESIALFTSFHLELKPLSGEKLGY